MNPEPRKNVSPVAQALAQKQTTQPAMGAQLSQAIALRPKLNSYAGRP